MCVCQNVDALLKDTKHTSLSLFQWRFRHSGWNDGICCLFVSILIGQSVPRLFLMSKHIANVGVVWKEPAMNEWHSNGEH